MNLREALQEKLPLKLRPFAPKAFDSYGSIALIEIPKQLRTKKVLVGKTLLALHPRFETVCSIESNHVGKYRVQKVKVIAGKKQTVATYKEFGCSFLVPLGKVFFSPRLSGERERIARLIQPNEIVGCWFSGVAPYPVVLAKHSPLKQAIAIELNPVAHTYAKKNIELNKVNKGLAKGEERVVAVKGDVTKVYKKYKAYFDRIAMPLPHTGYQFLKEAFYAIKPNGIIHFYEIIHKGDFALPENQIKQEAVKAGKRIEIVYKNKVREFSPTKEQVVFDIRVLP